MNSIFFIFVSIGIILTVWARYSSRDKAIEISRTLFRCFNDDLSKDYFEQLLTLAYTISMGLLLGLAFGFFFSSPIEYQKPDPLISLLCLIGVPFIRINYEFTFVIYKFFQKSKT